MLLAIDDPPLPLEAVIGCFRIDDPTAFAKMASAGIDARAAATSETLTLSRN